MPNRIKSYFLQVGEVLRLRGPLAGEVRARTLHGLLVGLLMYIWIVHMPIFVPLFVARKAASVIANLFLTLIYLITLALLRWGSLRQASRLFLVGTWLAATGFIVLGGGAQSIALVYYVILPILAAWLLGASAAGVTTAVCLGGSLVLAILQQHGVPLPYYFPDAPLGNWSSLAMATLGAVVPVLFVLSALNEALEKRQGAAEELRQANEKLEMRVRERTAQLEDEIAERKRLQGDLELAARFPGENPNPVMRLGQGHIVDFANVHAQELLKTRGCVIGGEAPAEIAQPASAALRAGVPRQIERTYAGRTYLFSLAPIAQWGYVNLYATDITDRKRAEEALQESESRERARSAEFEALMEAAPVGIFRSEDTECRWMSGNRAAYDLLRRPRGSNLSKSGPEDEKPVNFRALKEGKEIPLPELPMQKAAATGLAVRDHEMDFVFEDGVTVNVLGNAVPLLDENGRPRGAVGTFLDITARKQAEEALRERAALLDLAHDTIMVREMDGTIRFWNRGAVEMYGYSPQEALGRSSHELLRTIFPQPLAEIEAGLLREGRWEGELRHTRGDGAAIVVASRWVLQPANDRSTRVMEINNDITERKRAEEALRRSEAELREAQRIAQVGSWTWEVPTDTVTWSEQIYRIFGRDPNLPAPSVAESTQLFTPESWVRLREAQQQTLQCGTPYLLDLEVVRTDGTTGWMLAHGEPELDSSGQVVRLRGTVQDITQRKRAEEALRASEERFRVLAEAMPQIVWSADPTGALEYVNTFALRYAGVGPEDKGGWKWASIVHPDDLAAEDAWRRARESGEGDQVELRLRRAGGEFRWHLMRAVPLRDEKGEVIQWIGTATDIHEQKMAEQELERRVVERTAELARSTALLETVTSNAPVILFATDAQGVFTVYTGKAITAAGHRSGDCLGKGFRDARMFDPTTVDGIRKALEGMESSVVGHGLWDTTFETSFTPLRDADGKITGMVGVSLNITERTRAEAALRESQALMSSIVDSTSDLIWSVDPERFGLLTFNTALRDNFLRRGVHLQIGMLPEDAFTDKDLAERWRGIYQRALAEGSYTIDYESATAGSMVVAANLLQRDGKVFGISVFAKDITQRVRAERELIRLNRALRALSAADQAMVRAQDESGLLQETCRILVEEGGYRFAWVGFAEQDAAKTVRAVAHAGIEGGYLETARITWADTARGRGPTGTAIRTERPMVCQNMLEDPRIAPWREEAARRGYVSSCALPLVVSGQTIGALTVYSARPEAFDTAEAELLAQLGADLAFGIESLRVRAERNRAEEALKAERQRLFAVLETLPPMICLLTPDYHVAFANRAFREKFGESLGRHCYEYCFGRTAPCDFCQSYNVLKTGGPYHWEVNGPDGSVIDAYDFPFTDVDGTPMILEMDIDITEAKKAKESLEKASAYNRSLLEASLDPLVTISPNGKITDVNSAAESVTGHLRQELIGTDFSDYFTDPQKARAGYEQVFREGWVQDYELEVRHRNGSTTPVLYNASVYRDQGGEVVGVFAAARDITTRQRAEEEVRRLNEELERRVQLRTAQLEASNKELEAFTYSVSHDLRAPLRAMDGFSRILLEEYRHCLPGEAQKYLDFVRASALQMGKLIDGLLGLSRLGRQELKKVPVKVSVVVRLSMDDLRADWEGRAVEFIVGALPTCEADPLLLRQVFVNLLSNALKFSRKREKVRIEVGAVRAGRLSRPEVARPPVAGQPQPGVPAPPPLPRALDPDSWVYYVRDNGVGFDMRYADKLFGVFQRLHRHIDFEGTGVGLATVQQIIHRHGGQVWAEAEVDQGATFYFTLGPSIGEASNTRGNA